MLGRIEGISVEKMSFLRKEHLGILNFLIAGHEIDNNFFLIKGDNTINQNIILLILLTFLTDELIFGIAHQLTLVDQLLVLLF